MPLPLLVDCRLIRQLLIDRCCNLFITSKVGTWGRAKGAAHCGCHCRLWDRDGRSYGIVVAVFVVVFKGVVDGIVSVPVLPCRATDFDRREATSIRFMKELFEGRVRLGGHGLPRVEFLQGEDVGHSEYVDGIRYDLVIGIQEFADALDLLALLESIEEHLRRVAGGHWAAEQGVVSI